MTKSSITLPSGEITIFANEEKNLPSLTNNSNKTIKLKIKAEGKWSYGGQGPFANEVDGDGNTAQTGRNPYMRFPEVTPSALVAVKHGQPVASGKEQTIELSPYEFVAFVNNDQPGVYGDNSGSLTIKWSIAAISSNDSSTTNKSVSVDNNTDIALPTGEITVFANEETNLPILTNESDKTITLKLEAEGLWTYGDSQIFAKEVDANGNSEKTGREPYVRFPHITPAALVAVKNDQAVASGKEQKVELKPGETVSFINNDQPGVYGDNHGSQTVKWSIFSAN
ncbi:MAG: hypothetical protein RLZZ338_525 [Cyanobacteriota bacterium]|jgi:beta-galactosidase beta subunit